MPAIECKEDWQRMLQSLRRNVDVFAGIVENMPDESPAKDFAGEKYGSCFKKLNGMLVHSYYHLGQIVLIKKMLGESGCPTSTALYKKP